MLLRLGAFVRLGRPIFLLGGFVLHGLGAAVAAYRGYTIDWTRFAWGQLAVTATQLMTHYSNDYFDLEADRANATPTQWSGGSRVLPNRELPPRVALVTAVTLAAVALAANVVPTTELASGLVAAALMLLPLVVSWGDSAPPLNFHSRA